VTFVRGAVDLDTFLPAALVPGLLASVSVKLLEQPGCCSACGVRQGAAGG
jgi:hypothetical protein